MNMININKITALKGDITVPGDKSISHRAVMISSLASGESRIQNLLLGQDCQATLSAFKSMGVSIIPEGNQILITGKGPASLSRPCNTLYLGNSGTTMRLLMGVLAGQKFEAVLTGDASLSQRPMKRVTQPLRAMGAQISGRDDANLAPITIKGTEPLKPINYKTEIASAQVKSSLMLAGLYADGLMSITEPYQSRDHTERMLMAFGADIKQDGLSIFIRGLNNKKLTPQDIEIPGDISSAAFFLVLATLTNGSEIKIDRCGINPTRTGILSVLGDMGAEIIITEEIHGFEPMATLVSKSSRLKAVSIEKKDIPLMIDEIPLIALCATQAEGVTVINGIDELRVKETDRVASILVNLRAFGADIQAEDESLIIKGPTRLKGSCVDSFGDHRIAMMSVIAGAIAEGSTSVSDTDCIGVSFPGFMDILRAII
jgi:3-phosphoshikimate 1-carboxyvinyltransferase